MVIGLVVAGAVVASVAVAAAVIGLGMVAGRKIGAAFGKTVEQVYEEQRLADYYNEQAYYQYVGRPHHRNYYQPSGYHHGVYNYNYYQ